jgi:hypothetical protein
MLIVVFPAEIRNRSFSDVSQKCSHPCQLAQSFSVLTWYFSQEEVCNCLSFDIMV